MNISELLTKNVEDTYHATLGMLDLVDEDALDWAPATGENWMTMGQLLRHLEHACGLMAVCFVSGDWSVMAEFAADESKRDPETGLLPASAMSPATSVADVRAAIEADKAKILGAIAEAGEERLVNEESVAPWNPSPRSLGYNLLESVQHLATHKSQLFYYLKLQGKPVHTGTLWGM
jgi:hypothetical protein